ncbi:MAG: hypothetical protein V1799_14795 [bacterium]
MKDYEGETRKALLKEQLLSEIQPFAHGAWAHITLNRLALFSRNLPESLSENQFERFRSAIQEYLQKVDELLGNITSTMTALGSDDEVVCALGGQAMALSAKLRLILEGRLNSEEVVSTEHELTQLIEHLLLGLHQLKDRVYSFFSCNPIVVIQRCIERHAGTAREKNEKASLLETGTSPTVAIAEHELERTIDLLLRYPVGHPIEGRTRSLLFIAQQSIDRFIVEVRDTGTTLHPEEWYGIFGESEHPGSSQELSAIPSILGKYEGDICFKESSHIKGMSVLLQLRIIR